MNISCQPPISELGLSPRSGGVYICHITREKPKPPRLFIGANMIKVQIPGKQTGGGERGVVAGFSAQSRKRLIELVNRWRELKNIAFVTLTYHDWPDDWRIWKNHLNLFLKRLAYHYPDAVGIWRMEYQKRGAPHFHLIITNILPPIDDFRQFVTKAWAAIAHEDSEYNGLYATNVKRVFSRKRAVLYVCKYAAKLTDPDDENPEHGRVWGKHGMIDETFHEYEIDRQFARQLKRAAAMLMQQANNGYLSTFIQLPDYKGWSIFGVGDGGEKQTLSILKLLQLLE